MTHLFSPDVLHRGMLKTSTFPSTIHYLLRGMRPLIRDSPGSTLIFNQEAREAQTVWLLQLSDAQADSIKAGATNYTDRASHWRCASVHLRDKTVVPRNYGLRRLRPGVRCCPFQKRDEPSTASNSLVSSGNESEARWTVTPTLMTFGPIDFKFVRVFPMHELAVTAE